MKKIFKSTNNSKKPVILISLVIALIICIGTVIGIKIQKQKIEQVSSTTSINEISEESTITEETSIDKVITESSTETTAEDNNTTTNDNKKNSNNGQSKNSANSTVHQSTTKSSNRSGSSSSTTTANHTTTKPDSHDHSDLNGNMGKWFNSRSEIETYFGETCNYWNSKLDKGEITWQEYVKSCPNGYECWSCPYCQKWTGNFYYNTKKWCTEGGDEHWLYNDRIGWYSTYNDAKNAADKYMETHNDVSGYTVQQCDCGMYTASFYN